MISLMLRTSVMLGAIFCVLAMPGFAGNVQAERRLHVGIHVGKSYGSYGHRSSYHHPYHPKKKYHRYYRYKSYGSPNRHFYRSRRHFSPHRYSYRRKGYAGEYESYRRYYDHSDQ